MPSASWLLAAGFAFVGWWYADGGRVLVGALFLVVAVVWAVIGLRQRRRN